MASIRRLDRSSPLYQFFPGSRRACRWTQYGRGPRFGAWAYKLWTAYLIGQSRRGLICDINRTLHVVGGWRTQEAQRLTRETYPGRLRDP